MMDKKEPIVFLMPEKFKDRDFKVQFCRHVEDLKNVFIVDMEQVKLRPPDPKFKFDISPIKDHRLNLVPVAKVV